LLGAALAVAVAVALVLVVEPWPVAPFVVFFFGGFAAEAAAVGFDFLPVEVSPLPAGLGLDSAASAEGSCLGVVWPAFDVDNCASAIVIS